ncbi:hypothetical protein Tco_0460420, partial [Tanacetum coccineum]
SFLKIQATLSKKKQLKKTHTKKSSSFKQGRKKVSDGSTGTTEVHEGTAQVHEGTAGANESTEPSMKDVEDEAGPSTFQDESNEFIQDDILIADTLVKITRSRRGAGIT